MVISANVTKARGIAGASRLARHTRTGRDGTPPQSGGIPPHFRAVDRPIGTDWLGRRHGRVPLCANSGLGWWFATSSRLGATCGLRLTVPDDFPSWWYPGRTPLVEISKV